MEIKPAEPAKGEVKINAEHAKKRKASIFKKAKIAVAGLMLSAATMVHGCEGEMDLSPYARTPEDAVEVCADAGVVRDGGIPGFDVPYEDAKDSGAALDSGTTKDTGPSCTSPNDSRVLLKLSIGGEQQVVEEGSKVKIGNKEYSVSLSANTGDLVLTSDTGEVVVVPRGKSGVVNGTGVKLVDQAADKLYFTSRALVSVSAGSDSSRAILGEKGTAVLNVGEFGVKLTSKGIEPWDNEGSVLVADLEITTPEYTITKEGVRIGKEGYKVVIGAEELSIAPVEFGNDLYQSANAPASLCTKTEVKITLVAD
ncbi:MAG: hypothetical protein N3G76_03230, partial [Candidatus Micrarchaeota archaeon]|nr:hypothetical protein [Candidatus Micrarchaeota archaeon]